MATTKTNTETPETVTTVLPNGTFTSDADLFGKRMDQTKATLIAELVSMELGYTKTHAAKLTKEQLAGMLSDFDTAARLNERNAETLNAARVAETTTMTVPVTIARPHGGEPEVHLTGCAHLGLKNKGYDVDWRADVESFDDVVYEMWGATGVASDTFEGGDDDEYRAHTLANFTQHTTIAPCARKALKSIMRKSSDVVEQLADVVELPKKKSKAQLRREQAEAIVAAPSIARQARRSSKAAAETSAASSKGEKRTAMHREEPFGKGAGALYYNEPQDRWYAFLKLDSGKKVKTTRSRDEAYAALVELRSAAAI